MIKTDFIKLYEELEALNEDLFVPELDSYKVILRGTDEPEIEFDFSFNYEHPGDNYFDPPYVKSEQLKHSLSLSFIVEELLMNFMAEDEVAAYEDMMSTRNFDEKVISSWIDKYFNKADEAYYRKNLSGYLYDKYGEAHQDN